MSSFASTPSSSLGLGAASASARPDTAARRFLGIRGLSVLFLAALVAAMVVLADRLISTWADEHLFLAWVLLWVVVFASLALFADAARVMARRAGAKLDRWSRSRAEARAEARMWDIARSDPRVMQELMLIQARETEERANADFDSALAPLGLESTPAAEQVPAAAGLAAIWNRWVAFRGEQALLQRYV